ERDGGDAHVQVQSVNQRQRYRRGKPEPSNDIEESGRPGKADQQDQPEPEPTYRKLRSGRMPLAELRGGDRVGHLDSMLASPIEREQPDSDADAGPKDEAMLEPVDDVILVGPALQRKLGEQRDRQADEDEGQRFHCSATSTTILV